MLASQKVIWILRIDAVFARVLGTAPRADKSFGLDTERIGYAINIVEETYDLRGVMYRYIVKAGSAQGQDVTFIHGGGRQCQLFGVGAERLIKLIQRSRPPIARDGVDEGVGCCVVRESCDLGTEVVGM